MNETKINWTELSWNPASGCDKVSAGCKYCYAEVISENKRGTPAFPVGFDVYMRPWKLAEPRRVKRASLIFTNSMTDMFHASITDAYRDQILEAMNASSHHRYQVLTKRPELAAKFFATRKVPDCMWLGTTIEHQETTFRADILRSIDARVRFISAEPLVGHIDQLDLTGIHWLISGGESGTHMAKPHIAEERGLARKNAKGKWEPRADRYHWIRDLRDMCIAGGTAFWHKQWGGVRPHDAGREVDGRTWDEMPVHVEGAMPRDYEHRSAHKAQVQLPILQ